MVALHSRIRVNIKKIPLHESIHKFLPWRPRGNSGLNEADLSASPIQ